MTKKITLMQPRKIRAGWYSITVVGFEQVLNREVEKEIHVDYVKDEDQSAPWGVFSRHDGVQRSDINDWKHARFFSLKDARTFALDVAAWWEAIELRGDKEAKFPNERDPKYRIWEAESDRKYQEVLKAHGLA